MFKLRVLCGIERLLYKLNTDILVRFQKFLLSAQSVITHEKNLELSKIEAAECQRNCWFPILFRSLFTQNILNIPRLSLDSLQRLLLPLVSPPLSRFCVQSEEFPWKIGKISLLDSYRTAARQCRNYLYSKEASFKNRMPRNKAGQS